MRVDRTARLGHVMTMRRAPSMSSLRLFMQVAYNRSFSETGRLTNVSQPALSRTIRLLEEQLGTRLFDRDSRNVRLTSAGEALLPIVERLAADFDHAFSELAQNFAGERGRVVVGALPSVAAGDLPLAIAALLQSHPKVEVIVRDQLSGNLYQQMQERQVDLAITTPPSADGFHFDPLFDDRLFVAYQPQDMPSDPPSIPASLIDETRLLLLEDGHCLKDHALSACNRPELRAEATMLGTSLHTIVQMVDNGLGMTMLPEMALKAGILDHTTIVARPLDADNAFRRIALVWRRASPRERDFQLLAEALAEAR